MFQTGYSELGNSQGKPKICTSISPPFTFLAFKFLEKDQVVNVIHKKKIFLNKFTLILIHFK